jgi:hypothetical protein
MNKQSLIRVRERVTARLANASFPAVKAGTVKNSLAMVGFASIITFAAMQANPQLASGLIQTVFPEASVIIEAETDVESVESVLGDVSYTSVDDKSEARMADYLSTRFRVSRDAMMDMVKYAGLAAQKHKLDPALVLAVAAVESGFNPYAASPMGAKGLMQVMSGIHRQKFEVYSDIRNAATNPQVNLMVGAEILRDCINRGGGVNGGLKLYLGVGTGDDNGYVGRVVSEAARIRAAAKGRIMDAQLQTKRDNAKVAVSSKTRPAPVKPSEETQRVERLLASDSDS